MKKTFYGFLTLAVILAATTGWLLYTAPHVSAACGSGYGFCNQISFNTSQYGSSDTSNFVALFATTTMASLATVGNSGDIINTVNQSGGSYTSTVPADLIFTTDSACSTKVTGWEFESYNSATGAVNVWINIGTLSHSNTSVIYMCYGNASVTTQQYTVSSTWDSNYVVVYHLPNGSSLSGHDSTSDNHTLGTITATAGTGQIDGGAAFNGSQYMGDENVSGLPSYLTISGAITIEAWVYPTNSSNYQNIVSANNGSSRSYNFYLEPNVNAFYWNNASSGYLSSPWQINAWNFVVVQANGFTTNFYINGQQVQSISDSGAQGLTLTDFYLGAELQGDFPLTGTEDEVRISNNTRSADQILADYNNQNSPNTFYTVGATQTGGGGGGGTNYPTPVQAIIKGQVIVKSQTIIN